jgi:predicted dehydrogenase
MSNEHKQRGTRRDFLRATAVTGASLLSGAVFAQDPANTSANDKVDFACIGVGGKGDSDTADAARFGNVVAVCDVDENMLAGALKKYPNARPYTDFRKMLDEMNKSVDAVTVSTPDHTHAPAAAMAMRMGKHCFCQKPLTHTIYEARRLGEIARQMKVATQMGNQGTADGGLRKNAALVRAGALGKVKEVHVWTDRPIWPQGVPRPAAALPPPSLRWSEWLGPAPFRPYGPGYHTFGWRGWWDFGTGALGDMACHTVNMAFMALDLRDPVSVVARTSGHNRDSYPKSSEIRFEFPANNKRPALSLFWYDGGWRPPADLVPDGDKMPASGSLLIGDKGKLYTPGDYGGGGRFIDPVDVGAPSFPESPGHFEEFIRAIKTGQPAMSNFPDYAGPLTETILLGNLAVWTDGKKIEWDAHNLRAKNAPEVSDVIFPRYRSGYAAL